MDSEDEDEIEYEPEELLLCGEAFTITTVAVMPISTLMKLDGNEVSGQKLWCGSVCLSVHLLLHCFEDVYNREVIELGAGTGVAGMLCSRRGAIKVWLSDHDEKCLSHMRHDCDINRIQNTEIIRLDWLSHSQDLITYWGGPAPPLALIAGDVLYKSSLVDPFFNTVRSLIELRPKSVLTLCHIPRAGVEHEYVVSRAIAMGFDVQKCSDDFKSHVSVSLCPVEDTTRAHIYKIRIPSPVLGQSLFGRISVAIVTPFKEPVVSDVAGDSLQEIDEDSFIATVRHVADGLASARSMISDSSDVGGIIVSGTTGEQHSLGVVEKGRLFEIAVNVSASFDVNVFGGVAATTIYDAVVLARHAVRAGCRGIMLGLPPYIKPSDNEATQYVEAVHTAVRNATSDRFDILLYNNVARNGTGPSVKCLVSLFQRGLICGIKHASTTPEVMMAEATAMLALDPSIKLYTGSDILSREVLCNQAPAPQFYGLTSIIGNLYPKEVALMITGLVSVSGHPLTLDKAKHLHDKVSEIAKICLGDCSIPVGLKYAMRQRSNGTLGGWPRLPLGNSLSEGKRSEINRVIESASLDVFF